MITLDSRTGSFTTRFDVAIDGGDLVFSPVGDACADGCCPAGEVEKYGIMQEFIGLVTDPHRGPRLELQLGCASVVQHDEQYVLVDSTHDSLLRLAKRTGPIFGALPGEEQRFSASSIREPVAWWIAAAGCLRFAAECREASRNDGSSHLLDDEIVGSATMRIKNGMPASNFTISYIPDQGFPGAYGLMLESYGAERQHSLLSERGRSGSRETLVKSGYGVASRTRWVMCGDPDDDAVRPPSAQYSLGGGHALRPDGLIGMIRRAFENMRRSGPPSVKGVPLPVRCEPLSSLPAFYVTFYLAENSGGSLLGLSDPHDVPDAQEGENAYVMCFPNHDVLDNMHWRRIYSSMYDALVKLHTHRSADDLAAGEEASPFYANVLERIWGVFAREASGCEVRFCPVCGKAFRAEGKTKYCSSECRRSYNNRHQRERDVLINRFILSEMAGRAPFSAKGAAHLMSERYGSTITPESVEKQLEKLLGEKPPKVRRRRGNPTGKVWEVVT